MGRRCAYHGGLRSDLLVGHEQARKGCDEVPRLRLVDDLPDTLLVDDIAQLARQVAESRHLARRGSGSRLEALAREELGT